MPDCSLPHIQKLIVENRTNRIIEICYAQATSRYGDPPYAPTTIPLIIARNAGSGSHGIKDLCVQNGILIAATGGSVSCLVQESGGPIKYQATYPEAAEGKFWSHLGWVLYPKTVVNLEGGTEERMVLEPLIDADALQDVRVLTE